MSLPAFRERIRAFAKNAKHPAARIKSDKFEALTERAYRELLTASGADVTDSVIASLSIAAVDTWLKSFEASYPANFAGVAVASPSERLDHANHNPPATIAPSPRDERIKMDAITFEWYSKLSASQKLAFSAGALKPPLALHRTEDRVAAAKLKLEATEESDADGDAASAFIADALAKHGLSNE